MEKEIEFILKIFTVPLILVMLIFVLRTILKIVSVFFEPVTTIAATTKKNNCDYCDMPLNGVKPIICKHCSGINK